LIEFSVVMSRYASASHFSISREDFERESLLKRRRQLSPPRANSLNKANAHNDSNVPKSSSFVRSKSKSNGRESSLRRLPSLQGHEFVALGRSPGGTNRSPRPNELNDSPHSRYSNSTDKSYVSDHRRRSLSASRGRTRERTPPSSRDWQYTEIDGCRYSRAQPTVRSAPIANAKDSRRSESTSRKHSTSRNRSRSPNRSNNSSQRQRSNSKTVARPLANEKKRSPSQSSYIAQRRTRSPSPTIGRRSSSSTTTRRPTSPTGEQSSSSSSRPTTTVDKELQRDIDRDEKKLKKAKRELKELEDEFAQLQQRLDAKKYEVMDLQIVVDGLHKRRELQQQFLRRESFTSGSSVSVPVAATRRDPSPEPQPPSRGVTRRSKRPIIDDDDETEDDEVEIIEKPPPVHVKEEDKRAARQARFGPTSASW
jgi:hypothetical protein